MSEEAGTNGNGTGGHLAMTPADAIGTGTPDAVDFRALELLVDRMIFARQAGITFNGQRKTWEAFGYDEIITAKQYRDRYARGGIAGRIIDALPNATWRGDVELVEDEDPKISTDFEKAWNEFSERLKVTPTLCRVDKLSRLSTYAVLLIGTTDGDLAQELPKGKNHEQIQFLSPFAGGGGPGFTERAGTNQDMGAAYVDATIRDLDVDAKSPRFGLPLTYQLRRLDTTSPAFLTPVHWSRVVHVAEGCLDNEIYGQPALERCWNLLDDLDKVTGGGAEAFYLRANPGLHVDVDKDMKLANEASDKADLKDQLERWRHKLSDRYFRTRGVKIDMLASDVANFSQPADAILTQIAGACSMPKRILTGSEMGELASSQDRDNWKDQINGRQTGHAGPNILRQLADRLIEYGYLPKPAQYEVRWAHIQTLTEQEKAEGAQKWAQVNATMGLTVFTDADIRDKWYGMEPTKETDQELWRANLAEKMALTNKTQGITVFTDDEIRKTCYNWDPLTPEEKVPIGAPERISVKVPPPLGSDGKPIPAPGTAADAANPGAPLVSAEEAETLRVLEDAIKAGNVDVISRIIGIKHQDVPTRKYATTQVQLPSEMAEALGNFEIPAADLADKGRETDAHVTVKYGLLSDDPARVQDALAKFGPVSFTLGNVGVFSATDYDVVQVAVVSDDLVRLNRRVAQLGTVDTQPYYMPHATIAYVRPGTGIKYAGDRRFAGMRATVDALTFSPSDRSGTTEVALD